MTNSATIVLEKPVELIDSKSKVFMREALTLVTMAASIAVPLLFIALVWI
ncbi:hypothetical protein VTH8203_02800 [Vibrio thalassae]|uniref:Uncharacterized protein n=1 Tax=Vibrio thalassae TaxID=1243014 RepID=A0A240EKD2_9VIBR|nr:hypothetical protein [Vibrio thalassae]SNX49157.1 hypothetical protein VTH8203_02800 [Vibrio thalassae]